MRLNDASFVLGDGRINDLAPDRLQSRKGTDLVGTHKPGITGDICRQHCRQPPLDAPARHEAPVDCTLGIKAQGLEHFHSGKARKSAV
jgi:hypothetical protein